MKAVRTRFAPSPTGTPESIHLGFVIRALWNYAFAKKNNGQFVLRIEDTDRKRSRQDTEKTLIKILKSFCIQWDEGPDTGGPFGPYRQSERLEKYKKAAHLLVDKGYAYYDFDTQKREKEEIVKERESGQALKSIQERPTARFQDPKEAKKRVAANEPFVIRAKIPQDKNFEYFDCILKKKISFLGKFAPDQILLKSDGYPTYHLAVVVDDIEMQISHVFRGQEWISSTPVHLHLYEGLDKPIPQIGHFTVILDPKTLKKFSKRDLTSFFGVENWVKNGYLHEAILNYLMLLGWAPKDNRELFTLEEFTKSFDLDGVQKANPIFNANKLNWFNQQYLKKLSDEDLAAKLKNFSSHDDQEIVKLLPLVKDRLVTLKDFDQLTEYFFTRPKPQPQNKEILSHAIQVLQNNFDGKILEERARKFCAENEVKVGDYFMALRVAVTGLTATPPLWEVMQILGKEETLIRLNQALL